MNNRRRGTLIGLAVGDALGVIGDLNYSFFDGQGGTNSNWNIFPALGVEAVRAMVKAQKTVVLAAGKYKLMALRAAVQGRLCNVLITDEQAAVALLVET